MRDILVIFGAAVRADGSPSGSLQRRVEGAVAAARGLDAPLIIPSGGIGRYPPAEAIVMRDLLLAAGVDEAQIMLEPLARDTLETVRFVDALLRDRDDVGRLLVCTSRYHQPRCAMLFRLLGYTVVAPAMPADRPALGFAKWARYVMKEAIATPYDVALLLGGRRAAPR